jgi:hypothetical protein
METSQTHILLMFVFVFGLIIGWHSTDGHKTQSIRLMDVFLYGPFLCLLAFKPDIYQESILFQGLLMLIGSTTMTYNLKNWFAENDFFSVERQKNKDFFKKKTSCPESLV